MASHNGCYVFLLLSLWLTLLPTLIVHSVAIFDVGNKIGLFSTTIFKLEAEYSTDLTQAFWGQYVWLAVYAYQLLWLIYVSSTFARLDNEKDFVYIVGPVHSWLFYLLNILGMAQIMGWLVLFMSGGLIASSIISATGFLTILFAFVIAVRGLAKHNTDLTKMALVREHRLIIGFVHNGLGALLGWATFHALVMMSRCLEFATGAVTSTTSANFVTATLLAGVGLLALYAMFDMLFEVRTRFVYTPYVVALLSGGATYQRAAALTGFATQSNYLLVMAQPGMAAMLLVVKVVVSIVMEVKRPAFREDLLAEVESDFGSAE